MTGEESVVNTLKSITLKYRKKKSPLEATHSRWAPVCHVWPEQARALRAFKMESAPSEESPRRRAAREELEMRVAAMELALSYAGSAEAVEAALSVCPAVVRGHAGQRTLFRAALFNMLDVLQALLVGGADPNGPFAAHQDGSTPLHAAAYRGNHACLETLLRSGARVNVACRRGFTPLHAAAVPGHVACARTLLLAGADCSRRDALGHVAMCYAVQNANVPLARVILQYQAAALAKNGKTLRDVYGADAPKCRHDLSTAFAQWLPLAYRKHIDSKRNKS